MATAEKDKTAAAAKPAAKPATEAKKRGRKPGSKMSDAQKAALAAGRDESRKVAVYLEALSHRPKRGRKVTKETLTARLATVDQGLANGASPLDRLKLVQEKMDIENALKNFTEEFDIEALQAEFIKIAKPYAARQGLTRAAFKAIGVPVKVLKEAGI